MVDELIDDKNSDSDSDFDNKNQINDYQYLIIRLKKIKKNITLLENNILFK